jgi:hypothetical protein
MAQLIQAKDLDFDILREQFAIIEADDEQFFFEWQATVPEATADEYAWMERIRNNYRDLFNGRAFSEESVKMVVLSPLLDMAGFYRRPFRLETETSVSVEGEDEGQMYRGKIDVLLVNRRFWVLVVEAKSTIFNARLGLPQALFYLFGAPEPERPAFALLTNGIDFVFVKLQRVGFGAQYGLSRVFSLLKPTTDLPIVLGLLKHLSGAAVSSGGAG